VGQDDLYQEAAATFGAALDRLARAYEADPDKRRDLGQEIHLALWRSFAGWKGQCSLRTWVYRVAHNAATSHVIRQRRANAHTLITLEELECLPDRRVDGSAADTHRELERLLGLIQSLKPQDRQVILSYLEGMDAVSIAEITGLSSGNVATKIHRIKSILTPPVSGRRMPWIVSFPRIVSRTSGRTRARSLFKCHSESFGKKQRNFKRGFAIATCGNMWRQHLSLPHSRISHGDSLRCVWGAVLSWLAPFT
jgi:RNA polymerase sigma-70 factor (ECF subfamily)